MDGGDDEAGFDLSHQQLTTRQVLQCSDPVNGSPRCTRSTRKGKKKGRVDGSEGEVLCVFGVGGKDGCTVSINTTGPSLTAVNTKHSTLCESDQSRANSRVTLASIAPRLSRPWISAWLSLGACSILDPQKNRSLDSQGQVNPQFICGNYTVHSQAPSCPRQRRGSLPLSVPQLQGELQ